MTLLSLAATICAGIIAWTLTEYLVHRFDGHGYRLIIPNHLHHHSDPVEYGVSYTSYAALTMFTAIWMLLGWPVGLAVHGLIFGLTFSCSLRYYEWLHDALHDHAPRTAYGRWARRHHFFHHFKDPSLNHGVTSPVWDIVFRTHQPVREMMVPRKMAMKWLFDEAGEALPAYTSTYKVRGRAPSNTKTAARSAMSA
jgi:sterol desaturase/sphingolipid hydroxylase (fatty acid hydroxylase superfamily)